MLIEIEVLGTLIIGLFFIFQIAVPVARKERLFPFFRRSDNIDKKIEDARHAKEKAEKEAELAHIEAETAQILEQNKHILKSTEGENANQPNKTETETTQTTTQTETGPANDNKANS